MCFMHADLTCTPLQAGQLQHILQTVWTRLQFPETLQMDMAIKYSRHQFAAKLSLVSSLHAVSDPFLSIFVTIVAHTEVKLRTFKASLKM